MPEEQWQISGGESALSGPDPRRREEEFFLFQREDPQFYKWWQLQGILQAPSRLY